MPLSISSTHRPTEGAAPGAGSSLLRTENTAPGVPTEAQALQAELRELSKEIKQVSNAHRQHLRHARYEDVRQYPLSTGQKIKDLWDGFKMAGSGHKPGHLPNRSMQAAWEAEERLRQLNKRYIPLATAQALAQMGEQVLDAESSLKGLSADKAAVVQTQIDRLKERFEAAKFAYAIDIGQALAKDTAPLLPLINLTTYRGLQEAGQGIQAAADAAWGLYNQQCTRPDRLQENQAGLYLDDARRAAAVDHGKNIVDDLSEKRAAAMPADKQWLEAFTAQARQLLSQVDAALSLPGAEAADLEEVRVLLRDLVGKASAAPSGGYGVANEVYRETTLSSQAHGAGHEIQHMAGALGAWLLGRGLLMTQRVGQAIEQNTSLALMTLLTYGAVSTFYSHWCLPPSPGLEEPVTPGGLTMLDKDVDIALATPVPGHPDALLGQLLNEALNTYASRERRSAVQRHEPAAGSMASILNRRLPDSTLTYGELLRTSGHVDTSIDDTLLANATASGMQRFQVREAAQRAGYEKILVSKMDGAIDQAVAWMNTLYAPILQPSAVVDTAIEASIREYQNSTGTATNLNPQSRIKVVYKEAQPDDPNLHITAAVAKTKSYTLKEVVTGTYLNDVRLMRDQFGRRFKVVSIEQKPLVDFIDKGKLRGRLEADFSAYKQRPGLEKSWLTFYGARVNNAASNYVASTHVDHPGHVLMADFMNGDRQASHVKFQGATVNGVFAVTQGQTAVLCSVDGDKCFYIGEQTNAYWKLGERRSENAPVYPTDSEFKQWIQIKLDLFEQLKTARNPAAFDVSKTQFSNNALIGMPLNGGQVNVKPFSFEPCENIMELSQGLYDSSMDRIRSDIDTLIFTDWEQFGLEALEVIKGIMDLYSYSLMFMAPGTGTLLSRAMLAGAGAGVSLASSGVSHLHASISDEPIERDAAQRQAVGSLVAAGLQVALPVAVEGSVKVVQGASVANRVASQIGYQRFANRYIQSNMPRVLKEVAAKRLATGAGPLPRAPAIDAKAFGSAASVSNTWQRMGVAVTQGGSKPVPGAGWLQLNDVQRGTYLADKLLDTNVGRRLALETTQQSVRQSVTHNLRQVTTDAGQPSLNLAGERVATQRARSLLEDEWTRLEANNKFLRTMTRHPPTLQPLEASGAPTQAAASWIAASSRVKVPEGRVRQVIEQFRNADLTSISTLDEINRAMSGTSASTIPQVFRPSGRDGLMGSDIAHGAFARNLDSLAVPKGMSRAEWLFALTQTLQPYPAHNDPTARIFYALAQLQDGRGEGFKSLVKLAEQQLSPPVAAVKKSMPVKPVAPTAKAVIDTRVEPLRQIDADSSAALPPAMRGFMDHLRRNPRLEKAFIAPAGECANAADIVGEFMKDNGFENIKYRSMLIWNSRNPDGVFNHFFPIGDYQGKTYAFDLTAPQFASKGMPSLAEPMILPEPALMRAYRDASAKALIKYKDFSNLRSAEVAFKDFLAPAPGEFIEGGHILSRGWSQPSVPPAVAARAPSSRAASVSSQDIAAHRAAATVGSRQAARQMRRVDRGSIATPSTVPPSPLSITEQSRQAIQRSLPIARARLDAAIRTAQAPGHVEDTKKVARLFYGSDTPETLKALQRKQQLMKADLGQLKMDNIDFIHSSEPGWSAQLQPSSYADYKAGALNEKYIEVNVDGAMQYYRDMGSSDDTLANTLIHEVSHGMPADDDFVYAGKLRGAREDIVDLLNLGKSTNPKDFRYVSGDVEDGTVSLFARDPQMHNADSTAFVAALLDQAASNRPLFEANMAAIDGAVARSGGGLIKETVAVRIIDKRSVSDRPPPGYLLARNERNGQIVGVFGKVPAPGEKTVKIVDVVRSVFQWR